MEAKCSKGHTGEMVERSDKPGQYRCKRCKRDAIRLKVAARVAQGLRADGQERRATSDVGRFWLHVTPKAEHECWVFRPTSLGRVKENPKSRSSQYRTFMYEGRNGMAHRFSYELHIGPIPSDGDWTIDHLCENKTCVNPKHLELVTRSVNSIRRGARARKRKVNTSL